MSELKDLKVVRDDYSLPRIYTEDMTECASDRVFNGWERMFAASPKLYRALRRLVEATEHVLNKHDAWNDDIEDAIVQADEALRLSEVMK